MLRTEFWIHLRLHSLTGYRFRSASSAKREILSTFVLLVAKDREQRIIVQSPYEDVIGSWLLSLQVPQLLLNDEKTSISILKTPIHIATIAVVILHSPNSSKQSYEYKRPEVPLLSNEIVFAQDVPKYILKRRANIWHVVTHHFEIEIWWRLWKVLIEVLWHSWTDPRYSNKLILLMMV